MSYVCFDNYNCDNVHSVFNAHSKKSFDTLSDRNKKDEVVSITKEKLNGKIGR